MQKLKICQLVISLLILLICVLSVHSFPEPFWIKNLCDPSKKPLFQFGQKDSQHMPQNRVLTDQTWRGQERMSGKSDYAPELHGMLQDGAGYWLVVEFRQLGVVQQTHAAQCTWYARPRGLHLGEDGVQQTAVTIFAQGQDIIQHLCGIKKLLGVLPGWAQR
jgi:hypothetical protein